MSALKDTGGPAFPQPMQIDKDGTVQFPEAWGLGGMTLRDYFAAKAMPMLAAEFYSQKKQLETGTVADLVSPVAYQFADAMLKARAA